MLHELSHLSLDKIFKATGGGGSQLWWHTSVMPSISMLEKLRQVDREHEAILEYTKNQNPIPVTEWDWLKTEINKL